MISARNDCQKFVIYSINQTVGIIDSTRPKAGKIFFDIGQSILINGWHLRGTLKDERFPNSY
jgi:hypothetical protein